MSSSLNHIQHRHMSTVHSNTSNFSITDSVDVIKQEYLTLHAELIKARSERDELELKRAYSPSHLHTNPRHLTSRSVESQASEMGSMRRSIFDLEAQHERAHHYYEDEIKRIRSELLAAHQSGTAPIPLGIPGRSPRQLGALSVPLPNTPSMTEAQSNSQLLRHRALVPERELRDRARDGDLDLDHHDVKRQKTRRNYTGSYFYWFHFQMLRRI